MIQYKNVFKSFDKMEVIRDFSLDCKEGTINCLVGKNGAGKSTLVNLSMGLLKADSGNIRILGEKIDRKNRSIIRNVGYVLDEPIYVESFSANEQLEFLGRLYRIPNLKSRIDDLISFFNLPTDNKMRISQYSSGTKAKVALACALIHQPKILILDEPFKGLDLISYDKVLSYLKKYATKGNCILITSHQIDVIIEISDRVALLKNGKLHFNYSVVELQEKAIEIQSEKNSIKKFLIDQLEYEN